jgi:importin-7
LIFYKQSRIVEPASPVRRVPMFWQLGVYAHNMTTAAVYLKNRITRGWPPQEENVLHKSVPDNERDSFRDRLLPLIAASPPLIRGQLLPILQTILNHDFPNKWPTFMDVTLQLLSTNDATSLLAGLQCLLSICRTYRYKAGETRADLDKIVAVAFPPLLNLGNKLVEGDSAEAGEMLRLVVKCYKHVIYVCQGSRVCSLQLTHIYSTSFRSIFEVSRRQWTGAHSSSGSSTRCLLLVRC